MPATNGNRERLQRIRVKILVSNDAEELGKGSRHLALVPPGHRKELREHSPGDQGFYWSDAPIILLKLPREDIDFLPKEDVDFYKLFWFE